MLVEKYPTNKCLGGEVRLFWRYMVEPSKRTLLIEKRRKTTYPK
jgi:hypothetical protein